MQTMEQLTTAAPHGQRVERGSAMTDHIDGDDYTLRVLIERMQRIGSSEREIDMAVWNASGCLAHPASPRGTARWRPSFPVIGRRLHATRQLGKRGEGQ